jgi:hypothetical protein
MGSLAKLMLGAAVLVGAAGLGAAPARAAEIGVVVGAPVAFVPPCPGAGYVWVAPYRVGGYWYPGRWNFVGVRGRVGVERFDRGRFYDHRFDDRRFNDHDRFRR